MQGYASRAWTTHRPRLRSAGSHTPSASPSSSRSSGTCWRSENEPLLHEAHRQPPAEQREADQERDVPDVDPTAESERRMADELDAVEERVEVARDLRPLGQPAQREEGAGHQEQRRQQAALPVGEALDRA